jgi:Smg protein
MNTNHRFHRRQKALITLGLNSEMKESVLDILIYLFENYVDTEIDVTPEPDRATLKTELEQAGFADREIDQALIWLESLSTSPMRSSPAPTSRAIRVFDASECARLDLACRGYIMHLENLGILSPVQREWVIDRLLALSTDEIDMEQVKWVVLMVLFSQPDEANAYARMEDLVFEEQTEYAVH